MKTIMENENQEHANQSTESLSPTQEHTPTPWYLATMNDAFFIINTLPHSVPVDHLTPGRPDTKVIAAMGLDEADARFIIRAANGHEALVKALKGITLIAGILSDEAAEGVDGILDARSRAFMVTQARKMAANALALAGEPVSSEQKG